LYWVNRSKYNHPTHAIAVEDKERKKEGGGKRKERRRNLIFIG
jgi:hypothetical protein